MKRLISILMLGLVLLAMTLCFVQCNTAKDPHPDELFVKTMERSDTIIETRKWVTPISAEGDCFNYVIYYIIPVGNDSTQQIFAETPQQYGSSFANLTDAVAACNYTLLMIQERGGTPIEREILRGSCRHPEILYHDEKSFTPISLPEDMYVL